MVNNLLKILKEWWRDDEEAYYAARRKELREQLSEAARYAR